MEWFKFLLEKLSLLQTHQIEREGLSQMASRFNINRRKYARVRVPVAREQGLPVFMINGEVLEIVDLSEGGACLADPNNLISNNLGDEVQLQLAWGQSHSSEMIPGHLVGQSRMHYKHLQFHKLSVSNQTRISLLTRAGTAGSRLKKTPLNLSPEIQTPMSEMWTGLGSDHLIFHDEGPIFAILSMNAALIKVFKDGRFEGLPAPDMISEVLVFLENINKPSFRVMSLSHLLVSHPETGEKGKAS